MTALIGRAGTYLRQPSGYSAFFPTPLPPNPPLIMSDGLSTALSRPIALWDASTAR